MTEEQNRRKQQEGTGGTLIQLVESVDSPDGRLRKAGGGDRSRNFPPETAFSKELPPFHIQK